MTTEDNPPSQQSAEDAKPSKVKYSKLTNIKLPPEGESSFSMWTWDYWHDQFDQQRLQRLQQCHALQQTLKACEAKHNKKKKAKDAPQLDQFGGGIRMLTYYGWRHYLPSPVNQKGCIPEKHAVWTCRAISLACGKDLQKLKDCFKEEGSEAILGQRQTAYDKAKPNLSKSIPCYEFQRALGDCVAAGARTLETNIQTRKNKLEKQEQEESE